jgi:uncharacterized protein with HEPN domain
VRIWFIHHIEVIGEAVARLSDSLKITHKEIPWGQITGMRNILVHQYFGVDLEEVWATATKDMPELKKQMILISKEMK